MSIKYSQEQLKNLSQKELIALIQKLTSEKKYGLVWEDFEEPTEEGEISVDILEKLCINLEAKDNTETKKHCIIEGDNLHSLKYLQEEYVNKIDIIYIDPPYNTGKEFVYNDRITDKEDSFRHSKWLSFMSKRLKLAKQLLSEDGVIFVSIDDNEQAQLKLLMDEVFGGANFIAQLVWVYSRNNVVNGELLTHGANLGTIKKSKEYVLVYSKNKNLCKIGRKPVDKSSIIKSRITKNGNHRSSITLKKGLYCELENGVFEGVVGGNSEKITLKNKMVIGNNVLQNDVEIEAEFSNPSIVKQLLEGDYPVDRKNQKYKSLYLTRTGIPYTTKEKSGELFSDIISGFGGTAIGNQEMSDIFGDVVFNYPKPVEIIKYIINIYNNDSAIILDFFAGSGTTGHAVMELNKEDGGNRQFILCTNNEVSEEKVRQHFIEQGLLDKDTKTAFNTFYEENEQLVNDFYNSEEYQQLGIARSVTYERLKRVIEGYVTPKGKEVEGIKDNSVLYLCATNKNKEENVK